PAVNNVPATGTVTFVVDGVAYTVALSGGQAVLTVGGLTGGNHTVNASYGGDANYGSSDSSDLTEVVNPAPTSTTVTASPSPAVFGDTVTFTVTVSPNSVGGVAATGTVTFIIDGVAQPAVTLNNGQAVFTLTGMQGGTCTVSANYGGDANYGASSSSDF